MALAVALMIAVSLPSIRDEFFGGQDATNVADLFDSIPQVDPDGQFKISNGNQNGVQRVGTAVGTPVDYKPDQW